ncbi:hypothetical protein ACHAWF_005444 [Thalassiosira exigua]
MSSNEEFLAFLSAGTDHPQQVKGDGNNITTPELCGRHEAVESGPGQDPCILPTLSPLQQLPFPPTSLSEQLRLGSSKPRRSHTRSRSDLPSPSSLSQQLLMSSSSSSSTKLSSLSSKPKSNVQSHSNYEWVPQSDHLHIFNRVSTASTLTVGAKNVVAPPSAQASKSSAPSVSRKRITHHRRAKTDIGGHTIDKAELFKIATTIPVLPNRMPPLSFPRTIYQNNFSPGRGNALQAAVASIFGQTLLDVPNFCELSEGYETAITRFYQHGAEDGKCVKIKLDGPRSNTNSDGSYKASELRYLRSPEDKEQVAAIREKCINKIESLMNDESISVNRLEEFNKRLDELVGNISSKVPKVQLDIPAEFNDTICILRGKSPRGNFGHVVVAKHIAGGKFEMLHDPHPGGNFLDASESYGWCIFFV